MKTEAPSVQPVVAAFPCAVCGAQLDLLHMELGHEGALCTFCGARQPAELVGHPDGASPESGATSRTPTTDVGDALRQARHERGESLEQASRATRVRESYLRALEEDEQSFDPYPGRVYGRFFLREYAEYLGLDPEPLLRRFDHDALPALTPTLPRPLFRRAPHPRRWAIAALVVLVAMLGTAAIISQRGATTGLGPGASSKSHSTAPGRQSRSAVPPARVTGIHALIATTGANPCWVKAVVDGKTVFEQTMPGGQSQRFDASRTLDVTLGSAGAVELRVDGKTVPTGAVGATEHFSWAVRNGRLVRT